MEFNKESKSCTCKQSKMKNSFTTCHRQADVQLLPGKQSRSSVNGYLQRQMSQSLTSSLPPPFPELLLLSLMSYGAGCPFGQLEYLYTLSQVHLTPSLLALEQGGRDRERLDAV